MRDIARRAARSRRRGASIVSTMAFANHHEGNMSSTTPRARRIDRAAGIAAIAGLLLTGAGTATAAEIADEIGGEPKAAASAPTPTQATAAACKAQRPVPGFNRWQENWGALADPCL
ncbi:MAG: hypothetical protein V4789_29785, partial [Burkholderia gladioli]